RLANLRKRSRIQASLRPGATTIVVIAARPRGRMTSPIRGRHWRGSAERGAACAAVGTAAPPRSHRPEPVGAPETARPSARSPAEPPPVPRAAAIARTAFAPERRAGRGPRWTGGRGGDEAREVAGYVRSGRPGRRGGTGSCPR